MPILYLRSKLRFILNEIINETKFYYIFLERQKMYRENIDTKLLKRIQSKEFEEAVDQAVRSFMYDLDYMLLEEQQNSSSQNYSSIQANTVVKWINTV